MLRYCANASRLVYWLQSLDPDITLDGCKRFDSEVRRALTRITGLPDNDTHAAQAALPPRRGGLGLRLAQDIAPCAYRASYAAFVEQEEQYLNPPRETERTRAAEATILARAEAYSVDPARRLPDIEEEENPQRALQQVIDDALALHVRNLRAAEGDEALVRFLSVSNGSRKPMAWLSLAPNKARQRQLTNEELCVAMRLLYGAPVITSLAPCPQKCGKPMTDFHVTTCKTVIPRMHRLLAETVEAICREAGLHPIREAPGLLGDSKRPADIFLPDFDDGKRVCIDFARSHPFTCMAKCLKGECAADVYAEKKLSTTNATRSVEQGLVFVPACMDTFGCFSTQFVDLVRKLAAHTVVTRGGVHSHVVHRIFARISFAMIRG